MVKGGDGVWGGSDDEMIFNEFLKAGLELEPRELERLVWLHRLLLRRNHELDLTRIEDPRSIVVKHFVDSALAAGLIESRGVMMDLGSGAGFPGLPMAILRPDWRLLLAEPRARRLAFIEEAVELLGLANVEVHPHKVTAAFRGAIDSLVARDFGPSPAIVQLAAAVLPPGGRLHLMKGPAVDRELAEAARLPEWALFGDITDRTYSLGKGLPARRLITLVKGGRPGRRTSQGAPGQAAHRVREIASPMNSRYKGWLKLLDGRQAKRSGLALMSGRKSVPETLARHPGRVVSVLAVREADYAGLPVPPGAEVLHLRPEIFPALDVFGTGPPILVVDAPAPPPWDPALPHPGLRLFVPFQDPANVGTVIRTAAAMGVEVVLMREAAHPFHPKALRASGPAVFIAGLLAGPPLADLAPGPGFFALSPDGADIRGFDPPSPLNLVMGLEGQGLGGSWPGESRLSIPMRPGVESLNAAAAAAVAMALLACRRPG
jgi:16S rRNA (guanine527-N7)-methyltransferase